MTRVLRVLSGLFLGGYAFIKAVARLLRAGLMAMTPIHPWAWSRAAAAADGT